jgi:purine-cytosine permease-like protein
VNILRRGLRVKNFTYRLGATLFSAAAVLGLFAVTGFPMPMWKQVVISLSGAAAVQVYIEYLRRRQNPRTGG